jgi:acyl-CoA reductase-like NAD-dependent aldehyde dehydrogenase
LHSTPVRGRTSPAERQKYIERLNAAPARRADEIADLTSAENGIPRWLTGWSQAALDRQANAFLRAARTYCWEEPMDPTGGVKGVGCSLFTRPWPWTSAVTECAERSCTQRSTMVTSV